MTQRDRQIHKSIDLNHYIMVDKKQLCFRFWAISLSCINENEVTITPIFKQTHAWWDKKHIISVLYQNWFQFVTPIINNTINNSINYKGY